VLLIEGRMEPQIIEEWLDQIAQRHEILRTGFRVLPEASLPGQMISDRKFRFDTILDLRGLDEAEQEVEIERLKQEVRRPFHSFEQGTLMRAAIVILSGERKLLLIALSSLCSDRAGLVNLALELERSHSAGPSGADIGTRSAQYA